MNQSGDAPRPDAVLTAFGRTGTAVDMVAVERAWSNRVFRLTTDDGLFAVKQLRNPWEYPHWREWLGESWQFERRAYAAGVSMPGSIPNPQDDGCLAWVETVDGSDVVPVRLHHWVEGTPAPLGPVEPLVARWAGEVLATLHGFAIVPADRDLFPVPNTGIVEEWPDLVAAAHRHGASWASLLGEHSSSVEIIADLARSAALRPETEVMSHGDIDQKNIVLGGGPALCDWDVAAPVVPRQELADVAMSLAGWTNARVAGHVVAGYLDACGGAQLEFAPSDLGPSLMAGLDWLAFNVVRAIGTPPAEPAEVALGDRLVLELLGALPGQVASALRVEDFLMP